MFLKKLFLLFIFAYGISSYGYAQNHFESCTEEYQKGADDYMNNPDSAEVINKFITSQTKWISCLTTKSLHPFSVKTLTSKIISIDTLSNKIYILQFWKQSCPPCMAEIEIMNRLYKEFDSTKVIFLTLAEDLNIKKKYVGLFENEIVLGCNELTKNMGIISFPVIFIVSPKLKILNVFAGANLDDNEKLFDDLKRAITKVL